MRRRKQQPQERQAIEVRAVDRSDQLAYAPELLSAVERGCANFLPLVLAHYFRLPRWNRGSDADRAECAELLPQLMAQFEETHGRIVESYFCRNRFAAAVLTQNDEIRVVWGASEMQFPERTILLFDCRSLAYRAWHRLSESDRRHCQMMIFGVITEVLRRIDRRAVGTVGDDGDELQYLRDELEEARKFYWDAARQRARLRYTAGLLAGALAVAAILVPFVLAIVEAGDSRQEMRTIVLCAIAGATGAVVSVLSRMTFDRRTTLNLPNIESARRDLWVLGAMRPFVGTVFGLLMYVFINSTLLPVQTPTGDARRTFFFTSVAFLAGFSERFAQDVFLRSGRAVGEDEPGPAAREAAPAPAPPLPDTGRLNGAPHVAPSANGNGTAAAAMAGQPEHAVAEAAAAATETATGLAEPPGPPPPGRDDGTVA